MKENMDERSIGVEINIQELLIVYLQRWWIIVLCFLVSVSIALGVVWKFVTPKYQAKISLYVSNSQSVENAEYLSNADIIASQRLVNTYISIVKSDRVLQHMSEALGGEFSPEALNGFISAEKMDDTEIFCVYVRHTDPVVAARIANVAAEVAPVEIANLIEGTSARVIDTAKVPTSKYSPNYSKTALVGGVIGIALALVYLTIVHLRDTHIKDENDLIDLFDLPVLGRVPNFEVISSASGYGYYLQDDSKGETK